MQAWTMLRAGGGESGRSNRLDAHWSNLGFNGPYCGRWRAPMHYGIAAEHWHSLKGTRGMHGPGSLMQHTLEIMR